MKSIDRNQERKLTGSTVGDTSLAIRRHEELVGTNAFESDRSVLGRRQQTQSGTASIVDSARIGIGHLSERMENVQVVRPVRRVTQDRVISARPLIGPADGLQIPVGPENEIIEDGNGEDVRDFQRVLDNIATITAIQVGVGDVVEMSIGPKEFVSHVIDRQSIRPGQPLFVGHDTGEIASVHAQSSDISL